jgi:hypothetical protein
MAPVLLASFIVWAATVLAVMALCARVSGWLKLSRAYPCPGGCPKPRYWLGSMVFRNWFGYNNGIIVSADAHALHLTAMPVILAPTHPPVAVPWSEVLEIRREKRWFGELFEVKTRGLPDLRCGLRRRAFERVKDAAASARVTLALSLAVALLLPVLASAQVRGRLQTHLKKDDEAPDVCSADAPPGESCPEPDSAEGDDAAKTPGDGSATTETTAAAIAPTRHRWADPMGGVHGSRDNPQVRSEPSSPESDGPGGVGGGFSALSAPAVARAAKAAVKHQPDYGCDLEAVKAIHASMVPVDDAGSFEVAKRVAWKWRKHHAGLLIKRGGANIVPWRGDSFSAGRICYTHNGHIIKVVGGVSTGDKTFPECLDNGYLDDLTKCVPAMDPSLP